MHRLNCGSGWEDIKDKVPDPNEAENEMANAQNGLNGVVVEDESKAEGSPTAVLG